MSRVLLALTVFAMLPLLALAQPGGVNPGNQPPAGGQPARPADRPAATTPASPAPSGTAPAATSPVQGDASTKDPIVDEAVEFYKKGEIQKCIEKLTEAAQKNPNLPPAKIMLARIFGNAGQPQQARMALEQAAVEAPDHPDVFITLGQLALNEGRLTDAELQFREGLACAGRGKWTADQQKNIKINCLNGRAAVAERRGKWEVARDQLKGILEMEPKNGQIRNRFGRAIFMLGVEANDSKMKDAAANELEQAAKDDTTLLPYSVTMAQLYLGTKNKPKAEEWYNYGLKLDPKSEKTKLAFANYLMDEGKYEEAQKQLNEALALDPKSLESRFMNGLLARLKKDYATAERVFTELLVEKPDEANIKNQLALVLIMDRDEQKRQKAFQHAEGNLKANPRNAEIAATFGWVLYKLNRLDDAEKVLMQVYQTGNMSPDSAYYLACVLADRSKLDDAKKLLKGAIDSQGRFFNRADATDWMKTLSAKP